MIKPAHDWKVETHQKRKREISKDEGREKVVGTSACAVLLHGGSGDAKNKGDAGETGMEHPTGTGAWSVWGLEPGSRGKCCSPVQNHGVYHKSLIVCFGGKCHGNPFPAWHVTLGSPDEDAGPARYIPVLSFIHTG